MAISKTDYELTIYIDPIDGGPIKSLKLDMLEIEKSALGMEDKAQRDQMRIKEIAKRIKAKFPGVEPYDKQDMLAHFIRRFSHVSMFNGVVLQLPGTIVPDSENPDHDSDQESLEKLKEEKESLESEKSQLVSKVQEWEQQYEKDTLELPVLREQVKKYIQRFEELERKIKQLQEECDIAEDERDKAVAEAKRAKVRESRLEQENAALLVKDEQAQRQLRAFNKIQGEVADLRMENANLRNSTDQLRLSLEKCEQEKSSIKDQQRRKPAPQPPPDPVKPDQAKKNWIDP